MTVTDAPQVSQVAPEQTDLVIDKLNAWRDEMPAIDPNALMDKQPQAFAVTLDGRVVGGYLMIHIPMANEIVLLAIDPAYRRRGLGRMCCMDALFRSGKRPLVLTANDASVGFARTVGFKLVGKRKQADGSMLTRLGWHAPRPKSDPNAPPGC
ncbi:MAG TPA: N-acetyltransferase [Thermomicrobiales bacterium]|jgi:ribosomal protein S18 acetylase RimI-like enzyme|nr:N-acetyltransferase [Thermomicrobiales bacterium]